MKKESKEIELFTLTMIFFVSFLMVIISDFPFINEIKLKAGTYYYEQWQSDSVNSTDSNSIENNNENKKGDDTINGNDTSEQYCPDPSKFFNHGIRYENGEPWYEIKVDSNFENQFKRERNITSPLPFTPIYDLVVRIKPIFNYYCIPGWLEGTEIASDKLLRSVPIRSKLLINNEEMIISSEEMVKTNEKDSSGNFIYEWKIKGWPQGISSYNKLKKLYSAMENNETINFQITIPKDNGQEETLSLPANFSFCAPLWGEGQHRIITMYGLEKSALDTSSATKNAEELRTDGFEVIDPFKTYKKEFSHFVDLQPYKETKLLSEMTKIKSFNQITDSYNNAVKQSNCLGGTAYFLHAGEAILTDEDGLDSGIQGMANPDSPFILIVDDFPPLFKIHELGHTIGKLLDEYFVPGEMSYEDFQRYNTKYNVADFKNCSFNPKKDYVYNGKMYGEIDIAGCFIEKLILYPETNFEVISMYRPSVASIMSLNINTRKFNIVGCGYVLSSIKGGDPKSHWPECATKLDTIPLQKQPPVSDKQSGINKNLTGNVLATATQTETSPENTTPQCYLKLKIKADRGNSGPEFSLIEQSGFMDNPNENLILRESNGVQGYFIETYSQENLLIKKYPLPTTGHILGENFSQKRNLMLPLYDGVIDLTIPWNPQINYIKIKKGSTLTDLNFDKENITCDQINTAPQRNMGFYGKLKNLMGKLLNLF